MIKIQFCDFHREYDVTNNFFLDVIKNRMHEEYTLSNTPDFLIYSCEGTKHLDYTDCIKIFYTNEPITPNFNECDYAIAYDDIQFGNRYLKRPYFYNSGYPQPIQLSDDALLNRKFCNFVYSNDTRGTGARLRKEFALELMKYKHIDCPGKVLNNMKDAIQPRHNDWRRGKYEFIQNYKFTIAFENCSMLGYTTEKLEDPFCAHSIPIYWGNPDVFKYFNEKSFIYCDGTPQGITQTIEQIKFLDNNDDAYLEMIHEQPLKSLGNNKEDMTVFLENIFKSDSKLVSKDALDIWCQMTIPNYTGKELFLKLINKMKYFIGKR